MTEEYFKVLLDGKEICRYHFHKTVQEALNCALIWRKIYGLEDKNITIIGNERREEVFFIGNE